MQNALRLEVWGYTNKACLRRLGLVRAGGLRLYSREFYSPGICAKLGCSRRLEQGAKYIDLNDPERKEFTAMGAMSASRNNWYVPKTEVDYMLWNRLTEVQNPERLGEASES